MTSPNWPDRLAALRRKLRWSQDEMGAHLRRGREWVSRLENGGGKFSPDVMASIEQLELVAQRHTSVTQENLKSGGRTDFVLNDPAPSSERYGLQEEAAARPMPTRADCESYFRTVLNNAERDGAPENIPAIYHRLKKRFPLDEWEKDQPHKKTP